MKSAFVAALSAFRKQYRANKVEACKKYIAKNEKQTTKNSK